MLAEIVVLPENGVVHIARSLSYAEAACLPCAGVTAWNALFEGPRPIKPGDRVLVLGTGGVSVLALQLAKAVGEAQADERITTREEAIALARRLLREA